MFYIGSIWVSLEENMYITVTSHIEKKANCKIVIINGIIIVCHCSRVKSAAAFKMPMARITQKFTYFNFTETATNNNSFKKGKKPTKNSTSNLIVSIPKIMRKCFIMNNILYKFNLIKKE